MKRYCFALLFTMLIWISCAQAPQLSEQKNISPQKKTWTKSAPVNAVKSPQKKMGVPGVRLAETVHEFKPVPDGTIVSHDFVIKNNGDAVLILSRISAG